MVNLVFHRPDADPEHPCDLPVRSSINPAQDKDGPALTRKPPDSAAEILFEHCCLEISQGVLRSRRPGDRKFGIQFFVSLPASQIVLDKVAADPSEIRQEAQPWVKCSAVIPDPDERFLYDIMSGVALPGLKKHVPEKERLVFFEQEPEGLPVGFFHPFQEPGVCVWVIHCGRKTRSC